MACRGGVLVGVEVGVAVGVGVLVEFGGLLCVDDGRGLTSPLWWKITGKCVISGKEACAATTRIRAKNIANVHFNFAETIPILYSNPGRK